MPSEPFLAVLAQAIEVCRSGQESFARGAATVSDAHLRKFLSEYAEQRAQFALQVAGMIRQVGGEPEPTRASEASILEECRRSNDGAIETYCKALRQDMPAPARDLLEAQLLQIEEVRGQIAELLAHLHARPATG